LALAGEGRIEGNIERRTLNAEHRRGDKMTNAAFWGGTISNILFISAILSGSGGWEKLTVMFSGKPRWKWIGTEVI
jgi:hypothetical protein